MTSPLAVQTWETCLLPRTRDSALEKDLKKIGRGAPSPTTSYFMSCPWLARSILRLNWDRGLLVELDFDLSDLVALAVSQENACRFCYAVTRMQLRIMGMDEDRVQELERRLSADGLDAKTVAAVRFARRLSRSNPPPDRSELAALRAAGLSDNEVRELIFVIAGSCYYNRLMTMPALPPESMEKLPDSWFTPLIRPLVARMMRGWRWRGEPSVVTPETDVPGTSVLALLRGSPMADVLGLTLIELWGPTSLTRRSKALMVAVIARGLGCEALASDMHAVLVNEGLSRDDVEGIVEHLGGPALDPVETALVAFARDSIWYEARSIQRSARATRELVQEAAIVEAIGLASFANMLCRLQLALAPIA
jgi:AhpD family alkylhydroperoxidase